MVQAVAAVGPPQSPLPASHRLTILSAVAENEPDRIRVVYAPPVSQGVYGGGKQPFAHPTLACQLGEPWYFTGDNQLNLTPRRRRS
jgi:hypothetical protein